MKHTIVLSKSGVDNAIKVLRDYYRTMQDRAAELLVVLLRAGEDYAINGISNIDTGETLASVEYAVRGEKKGVIVAGGAAIWLEFGTGMFSPNQTGYDLPLPDGIVAHGEYGKRKGANPEGWYYPTDDERLAMHDKRGRPARTKDGKYLAHTMGIPANKFMYHSMLELQNSFPDLAKEVFGQYD